MIAIGCDHGGINIKNAVIEYMKENGIEYKDFGCDGEPVNYPDYADKVCRAIQSGECYRGILVCGTGIGMSMAANKHAGIRAACCSDTYSARMTRQHNDANVLCLGGRVLGFGLATDMVKLFLNTEFEGGRHQTRVDMLNALDNNK